MDKLSFPTEVVIFEVGPRDGLQNQREFIPTDKKVELINKLVAAGCKKIEVTSFVNPKWVPQMRDAKEVCARIERREGVVYSALIPNLKGLELALEAGLQEVVTIISASESHNKKNVNRSISQSLKEIEEINRIASENNVRVRSYIATAFGCPIEGDVPEEKVIDIALALEESGSYEISLGDTTGMANPIKAFELPKKLFKRLKHATLAVHYHQADGMEFANILASLQAGVPVFDGAAGGLGGCPYAPGATGNVATEILVEMFNRMGIKTGIDLNLIKECGRFAKSICNSCITN
ncbi:hydroxymethylglutaryl-CoA lyase [Caldicoprobacter guelmensis]|uniref:hydroxymethylglutaryl-CoA lyase n=1 Tax=Caldicoprobacter guelmensis TaxID=1170224 RepID=UPI00195EAEE3|nr:hydroxymethylglutaryl-CoA lyase [Caldicoprobacter guelmensis]MBM7583427.1 hydroxymethylglutaryl-CoA lyase [Caldicoprobacter guelmensis]